MTTKQLAILPTIALGLLVLIGLLTSHAFFYLLMVTHYVTMLVLNDYVLLSRDMQANS
jgi:hypothetical protein